MKIEFDLPEFEKELRVEIVLRRDGEVIYSSNPITSTQKDDVPEIDNKVENKTRPGRKSTKSTIYSSPSVNTPDNDRSFGLEGEGGNMMDIQL